MSGNPYEETEPTDPDDASVDLLAELRSNTEGADDSGDDDRDAEEVVIGAPVEDEDPEPGESPRQAKRRRRGEAYREQQREKSDATETLRRELAEVRGQLNGMQSRQVAERGAPDRSGEYEDRREEVRRARKETLEAYHVTNETARRENRELTEEEKQSFLRRHDKNQKSMNRIDFDEFRAESDTPQSRARAQLVVEFPDVMANPKAERYAKRLYEMAVDRGEAGDGHDDAELTRRVIDQTRRELKIGNYKNSPEASDKQKSTYGNLRGTGDRTSSKKRVNVSRDSPQWDMAQAMFSHMSDWSEAQKLQAWVNATKGS